MAEHDEKVRSKREWKGMKGGGGASGGAVYFLGFIGALVYNLQQATTFGADITGILKAFVWPAYLVYHLFLFIRI